MPKFLLGFPIQIVMAGCLWLFGSSALAEESGPETWPSEVVRIEDLKLIAAFQLRIPSIVVKGRVTGPTVLRAHLTSQGEVAKVALMQSCGNGDLDEAAIRALRATKFEPHRVNGLPTQATLLLPVHFPAKLGRQR